MTVCETRREGEAGDSLPADLRPVTAESLLHHEGATEPRSVTIEIRPRNGQAVREVVLTTDRSTHRIRSLTYSIVREPDVFEFTGYRRLPPRSWHSVHSASGRRYLLNQVVRRFNLPQDSHSTSFPKRTCRSYNAIQQAQKEPRRGSISGTRVSLFEGRRKFLVRRRREEAQEPSRHPRGQAGQAQSSAQAVQYGKLEQASLGTVRQTAKIAQGSSPKAKAIVRTIKDSKLKFRPRFRGPGTGGWKSKDACSEP